MLAWAAEGDLETTGLTSNLFQMEWPPRSGTFQSFPEVDEVRWCTVPEASRLLKAAQAELLERLTVLLDEARPRR